MNRLSRHTLFATLILIFTATASSAGPDALRPNVILMMADDLGYGDLSGYGSSLNRTPVLDRLAGEGVRLTDYHSGSTVCTPSRMALLSGYYPRRVGWPGGVLGYKMDAKGGLASEVRTIAEVFKAGGYRTGMVGKWHLGDHPDRLPMGQGFDYAYYIKMSNNQTKKLWRGDELLMNPFDNRRLTEHFMTEAIAFVRRNHKQPFFLYLPFTAPHFPVQSHPDWKGRSHNAAYGDVIEELDSRIGDLMKTLKELGIAKNTLVVFTSDNGPQNSHKNKTSAKPWRGYKWSPLEGGTRVPCIFYWPGKLPEGRTYKGLMGSIDMLPTLAQVAGLPWKAPDGAPPLDGKPMWDAITGENPAIVRDHLLLWNGWATPHAIRQGPWKLFFTKNEWVEDSTKGLVLFNLESDLTEMRNVAAQHPEKVSGLMSIARKELTDIEAHGIPLAGDGKPETPEPPSWLKLPLKK